MRPDRCLRATVFGPLGQVWAKGGRGYFIGRQHGAAHHLDVRLAQWYRLTDAANRRRIVRERGACAAAACARLGGAATAAYKAAGGEDGHAAAPARLRRALQSLHDLWTHGEHNSGGGYSCAVNPRRP
jgi:hypothetical protein